MNRHFTATGVVLHNGSTLLIEHSKLNLWLPPGGHLEPNEDPVQAVLREVAETTGLECALLAESRFAHEAVQEVPIPFTIVLEDVPEEGDAAQHIDFVYVLRPLSDPEAVAPRSAEVTGWRWVPIGRVADLPTAPEIPALVRAAADYAGE
ncbi:MAG TPA: NUDIX domain-containing protein [Actinocrinis sp.]|nr:NUDIX domain-containing protein [Actinocrinis sp.]